MASIMCVIEKGEWGTGACLNVGKVTHGFQQQVQSQCVIWGGEGRIDLCMYLLWGVVHGFQHR